MKTQKQPKLVFRPSGVVFTVEMDERIAQEARRRTISKSALIREAVREHFEQLDERSALKSA